MFLFVLIMFSFFVLGFVTGYVHQSLKTAHQRVQDYYDCCKIKHACCLCFRAFTDNVGPLLSKAAQSRGVSATQVVQEVLSQTGQLLDNTGLQEVLSQTDQFMDNTGLQEVLSQTGQLLDNTGLQEVLSQTGQFLDNTCPQEVLSQTDQCLDNTGLQEVIKVYKRSSRFTRGHHREISSWTVQVYRWSCHRQISSWTIQV